MQLQLIERISNITRFTYYIMMLGIKERDVGNAE